ncbi:MAG TPA: thiamine phosphate synthase, partial [Gemmataceae bacterium]|nr:thiamine phosphate synthase [Gemmataceae bacterium]
LAVADVRRTLIEQTTPSDPPAPPVAELFDAARDWSLSYRADTQFTTDAFLIVVLRCDSAFGQLAASLGLDADRLEAELISAAPRVPEPPSEPAAFTLPADTVEMDTARVLDANFNRAREALRVLEDYCRFVLDDCFLTSQIKSLRHDLGDVSQKVPPGLLLAARETQQDVGTGVSAVGEYDRGSAAQVAAANLKRLQESIRSLEEFGKLLGPELGRDLESLRYRAYTLERAVVLGWAARVRLAEARLYLLVCAEACEASLDGVIEQAAAGGVNVIQLREKSLADRELLARARDVRRWTRKAGVLFIVNDRPDIARLSDADGVHLGQDDLPVKEARRVLGPDALIGVSTHSVEQLRQAVLDGADYLGIGPTFPSKTKAFDRFPGLPFIRSATAETSLPAFALGGIGPQNVGLVVEAGARRVAVSAAITKADDPQQAARELRAALER